MLTGITCKAAERSVLGARVTHLGCAQLALDRSLLSFPEALGEAYGKKHNVRSRWIKMSFPSALTRYSPPSPFYFKHLAEGFACMLHGLLRP